MNQNNPEISENTITQDKNDTNLAQQNSDTNLAQLPPLQNTENKTEEKQEDPNWKAFREARKKDRLEREAAERKAAEKEAEVLALRAAMEAAFAKEQRNTQYTEQNYSNYETDETEDERIEKKVQAAISAREAAAEKARIEREQHEYPMRLQQQYPDFHNAISEENLDYLDYHFPEVSKPISRMQDGYEKWLYIYQAVKKFVPNNANVKKDAARAESNFNKPKSMSSTSVTQPGDSKQRENHFEVEQRRAARYAEMKKIINGI